MPLQALTELYQLLDKLNEQLGLAKNELFVANVGGRPFLLPVGIAPLTQEEAAGLYR